MRHQLSYTLEEIAQLLGNPPRSGEGDPGIRGIASLERAEPGDLSFLGNLKYRRYLASSRASVVLVPKEEPGEPPPGTVWLRVDNPSQALGRLCNEIAQQIFPRPTPGIHPSAVIDRRAVVNETAYVGPHCVIEAEARIGPRVVLEAQVFVGAHARIDEESHLSPFVYLAPYTQVGHRVRLHAGVKLGADGFGFSTIDGSHEKEAQIGNVIIEDDVEIGANSCVDRGRFADTRVGIGTKIDNLAQIGHNCRLGPGNLIAAQVGMSGSTTTGSHVTIAGQAGLGGHMHIGDKAIIGGQAGVVNNVEPGLYITGTPPLPIKQSYRIVALSRRLPEFFKRLEAVEEQLAASK